MWSSHFIPICPRKIKVYVYKKTYIQMFIAVLFVTVQKWKKKPKYSSVNGWTIYSISIQQNDTWQTEINYGFTQKHGLIQNNYAK